MPKERRKKEESLGDLGEREIIRRLISEFPSRSFIGLGDDCGAVELDERLIIMSTDTKSDEGHFPKGFTSFDKGWSIAAANLSDIAAMGGVPVAFMIAYGLPEGTPFSMLHDIEAGIDACLTEFSTPFVSADTKENKSLTLTGAIVGIVDKTDVLLRKGSKPGDSVCVTGSLGGAALGLKSLTSKLKNESAEERMRRPMPRIAEGRVLAKSGLVTSCIDISDGLSTSLYELMAASGNGFEIEAEQIPSHESLKESKMTAAQRIKMALHSGDEYELLFTIKPGAFGELKEMLSEIRADITEIGRVVSSKNVSLIDDERKIPLENLGYEHFRKH